MTQQILIDTKQLSGGYNRMHAVAIVLDIKEANNANQNIVITFKIDEILSGYTIPGLEYLYQAYFPGITSISRAPFNYDRLVESLGNSLVADQNGLVDLSQIVGKKYMITIQEQDSANGDYHFQNLINLIEYPFAKDPSTAWNNTATAFRRTVTPSVIPNLSRSNWDSLDQTAQNGEQGEFDPTDPRNEGVPF